MDLHEFCQELGWGEAEERFLYPNWAQLCANTTSELPFFMERKFYRKYVTMCNLPPDVPERMDTVAAQTAQNPICARYAAMLHYALYVATPEIPVAKLPLVEKFFGENAGIFHTMVGLSALPLIARTQAKMNLPQHMVADTATMFRGTNAIYAAGHNGLPGYNLRQLSWIRLHVEGKLFRIGRLEYLIGQLYEEMPAIYRHRRSHELAVLSRDQWNFDEHGVRLKPNTERPFFTAHLSIKDNRVTGTPINARGQLQMAQSRTLDLTEYEPICAPWDWVPSIHIPGGSPLDLAEVKDSLVQAKKFFMTYFNIEVQLFTCCSWIFDPVWEEELPDSHIGTLQRNVYLTVPLRHEHCGTSFVYGQECDPRQQKCTNRLHKAFCRIYNRNRSLCYGGMFLPAENIDQLGTEYFRHKYR